MSDQLKPRRFVRLFKPQFAGLVESGAKLQTVRPTPKRIPKPGDLISLRCWTGKPYRSKQRVLREATITYVGFVRIERRAFWRNGVFGCGHEFALADGFKDYPSLSEWFEAEHGLPFEGIVICWGALKRQ